ncbi:uncharacterized protein G2W53_015915 [Senna tora]|uniref:Uncharacterized protein n=1 Tax=Senna tora TaxID=362788 RepID=A0A835CAV9_9FABA|nr:uncharacterized protein G2W53_015915 [Senna tora]
MNEKEQEEEIEQSNSIEEKFNKREKRELTSRAHGVAQQMGAGIITGRGGASWLAAHRR